jgi:pyrimidine-nucleoside phosphorylase
MATIQMRDLIEAKKGGQPHAAAEIAAIVRGYTSGEVPDYQMAAWLMAVRWRGLDADETHALTEAMILSGESLDLAGAGLAGVTIDKHSTGGVGDKLSLIVVPLLIAAGATVVKLSGAGLGHTGGTIDKLRSIPHLRLELTPSEIYAVARRAGGCMAAQSASLVPADGQIYALRDLTGTVDSPALIAASVMAKKIACGASAIALDVKVGRGAFMRHLAEATALARQMVDLATRFDRRAVAVLTAMDQPLGHAVGNAIEVNEAVAVLRGEGQTVLRDLSLDLATHALRAATGGGQPISLTRAWLAQRLADGHALECFAALIQAQGGAANWLGDVDRGHYAQGAQGPLPLAGERAVIRATVPGQLLGIDALAIGRAAVQLGAGRSVKGQTVDPGAGIWLEVQPGEHVAVGQPLARLFTSDAARLAPSEATVRSAMAWRQETDQDTASYLPPGAVLGQVPAVLQPTEVDARDHADG